MILYWMRLWDRVEGCSGFRVSRSCRYVFYVHIIQKHTFLCLRVCMHFSCILFGLFRATVQVPCRCAYVCVIERERERDRETERQRERAREREREGGREGGRAGGREREIVCVSLRVFVCVRVCLCLSHCH